MREKSLEINCLNLTKNSMVYNAGLEKTRVFLPFFDSVKKPGFYWVFLKKPTDFGFFKIMIFAMYFKIRMFLKEKNLNYNDAKLC